ncbi:diaminopimelate decarboxylase (DAP decarboxylase) [Candidatus Glomeribacter gigasporarum BEG34]|uniref:Diaminopimelate decarboxylase n=1 Tax=Candidatus Glomeribacter gigasporarum BEG34 TaxID=1070319 RepID=G2J952_9BURK|nr:diaminopimelate decarboxylase [Candidatus Glomeribacter gigasporarum]CCD29299.1 diaminopimelate decarboxylase (DAP decarboxylase) [Candidatus Glomeribacter gigasporarum BEG34]
MPSDFFRFINGHLSVEDLPLAPLAERFGTPLYIYSRAALTHAYCAYARACAGRNARIYYAVKANSALAVLDVFARLGASFDIVSGGELARVLAAGGRAGQIVFSGVGKQRHEIRAALCAKVQCFNVESAPELHRLNEIAAQTGAQARVALRVNPDIDARTHPYIATGLKTDKFGIAFDEARAAARITAALSHLTLVGLACHIGSQITATAPYLDALDKMLALIEAIETDGAALSHLDIGGGLGIHYRPAGETNAEPPPGIEHFVSSVLDHVAQRGHAHRTLLFEPGRSLAGNAGALLTRIEYLKQSGEKRFAIVDAAMNDLMRPAMYQAYHDITPVIQRKDAMPALYDVAGPICESGDWLGRARRLAVQPGDLLAVHGAGAYGFVMSSNYNTRPRAAEVMVDGAQAYLIRERETVEQLFAGEARLPADALSYSQARHHAAQAAKIL